MSNNNSMRDNTWYGTRTVFKEGFFRSISKSAPVAQSAERHVANVKATGSKPVRRSRSPKYTAGPNLTPYEVRYDSNCILVHLGTGCKSKPIVQLVRQGKKLNINKGLGRAYCAGCRRILGKKAWRDLQKGMESDDVAVTLTSAYANPRGPKEEGGRILVRQFSRDGASAPDHVPPINSEVTSTGRLSAESQNPTKNMWRGAITFTPDPQPGETPFSSERAAAEVRLRENPLSSAVDPWPKKRPKKKRGGKRIRLPGRKAVPEPGVPVLDPEKLAQNRAELEKAVLEIARTPEKRDAFIGALDRLAEQKEEIREPIQEVAKQLKTAAAPWDQEWIEEDIDF